jgi:phosphoribosyl-AMP cyclohydrolase
MDPNFKRKLLYKSSAGEEKILECIIAIIQDAESKENLMHGFMNKEAWGKTQETKIVHFWSTSRDELWRKGETSGNEMEVIYQFLDCDLDSVVIGVRLKDGGVACHTGHKSCFFNGIV